MLADINMAVQKHLNPWLSSRFAAGVVRRLSENGGLSPADSLGTAASGTLDGMSDVDRKQRELYTRQQQLLREQRTADQEKLLSTISGLQTVV